MSAVTCNLLSSVTATAVSIAAVPVGIPLSSLTLSTLVLNTVGAPVQDIGLLFAIDWLLYSFQFYVYKFGFDV